MSKKLSKRMVFNKNWIEQYIKFLQIDQRYINKFRSENFDL